MICDLPYNYSKSQRLLNAAAFKAVFDQSDYKVSCRVLLCLAKESSHKSPRLGLVIAKKHVKLAVQRNRIKRLIRESFRLHQHEMPNVDLIILARKGIDEMDNAALNKELAKTWQRLQKQSNKSPWVFWK